MKTEWLFVRIALPKKLYFRKTRKYIHKRLAKKMAWELIEHMKIEDYYDEKTGMIVVDGNVTVVTGDKEE